MAFVLALDAYLSRIGCERPSSPSVETLRHLHAAHVGTIPFENLDIQMGQPIRLDMDSIQAKLVDQRRGGYCFEQNTLFCHMLRAMGFDVLMCEARVRLGSAITRARTHAVLVVGAEDQRWLCDVGFGGEGLLEPLALEGDAVRQHPWRYRLVPEGRLLVLQSARGDEWLDLYAMTTDGCHPADYEMANWYTSTHPESRFVQSLTAQRSLPHERRVLRNLTYTVFTGEGATVRDLHRTEIVPLLREEFGLDVPADATFIAIDKPMS